MNDQERLRTLLAIKELAPLGASAVRGLLSSFDEVFVRAGDGVAEAGRLCHEMVVVADGRLEIRTHGHACELGAGQAIGWAAMQKRGLWEASAVAKTDARLLVMSHAQFRAVAAAAPAKRRFPFWALPSSRRSLPHRQHLEGA